jgi:hypothetical protein
LEVFREDFTTSDRAEIMMAPVLTQGLGAEPREVTMHSFQAEQADNVTRASYSMIDRIAALAALRRLVAAILDRCKPVKIHGVPHYEGHAWCDSLEYQVNNDITMGRRARL